MECDGLTYWKFGVKTFGGRRTGGGSGRFRLRLDNGFMSRARVFRTTRVATHPSARRARVTPQIARREDASHSISTQTKCDYPFDTSNAQEYLPPEHYYNK